MTDVRPQRWALGVEYDGQCFHGWQTQGPAPHAVGERADVLDPQTDHVARLEELPPCGADAGGRSPDVVIDTHTLPFDAASLDLVLLPHTLELSHDPHATLREVHRVLVPEGKGKPKAAEPVWQPVALVKGESWRKAQARMAEMLAGVEGTSSLPARAGLVKSDLLQRLLAGVGGNRRPGGLRRGRGRGPGATGAATP